MRIKPGIDRVRAVLVDRVNMEIFYIRFPVQYFQFLPEVAAGIPAENQNVEGPFLQQGSVLVIVEHHGNGASQQGKHEKGGKAAQGKAEGLHLGGKLPQQEQVLAPENTVSLFPNVTDNPGCHAGIKEINGQNQTDEKAQYGKAVPGFIKKQHQGEGGQKQEGER